MSELMVRKMIRNILLETRGPLPIPIILREWVKVAAKYGTTDNQPYIDGPDQHTNSGNAETATLIVPKQHAQKVFDGFTPELQEYILKHWRSEEYFRAMISGVKIGIVRAYERANYAGMKSGFTQISGEINEEGKMVGSMSGYLTTKYRGEYNRKWCNSSFPQSSLIKNPRWVRNGLEINRSKWEEIMLEDIAQYESTLVHEFQHWIQESIYYPEPIIQIPTQRRGKRNEKPLPRKTTPNIKSLKPIHLMMAKKGFKGVDWNTTMRVRGAIAYKLSDPEAFFDSYNPNKIKDKYTGMSMEKLVLSKINSDGARRAFIEELLYDYLKLQNILDHKDIEDISEYSKTGTWSPIRSRVQRILWDKGIRVSTQIGGEDVGNQYGRTPNPARDTPRGSGETTEQGTDSLLKSLGSYFNIFVLRSSDFDKQGKLKPGKEPVKPTAARAAKATWVVLGFGIQSLPRKMSGTSEWKLIRQRGTDKEKGHSHSVHQRPEWTDRWVEFDAVASEYMAGTVRNNVSQGHMITHHLVQSNKSGFVQWVNDTVRGRLRRRGFTHQNEEVNANHVKSMAERIADRLIEVTEENPYDEWYDMKIKSGTRASQLVPIERFETWASEESPTSAPMGTRDYWRWIFSKAAGDDV